jgi:hypothetical protein
MSKVKATSSRETKTQRNRRLYQTIVKNGAQAARERARKLGMTLTEFFAKDYIPQFADDPDAVVLGLDMLAYLAASDADEILAAYGGGR